VDVFGQPNTSQPDLNLQNQQGILARNATHNKQNEEKLLPF
jgi:hypothetical protein